MHCSDMNMQLTEWAAPRMMDFQHDGFGVGGHFTSLHTKKEKKKKQKVREGER